MNIFALSGLLIGISNTVMAAFMFIKGKEKLHYLWGFFCISAMFWGFGGYKIATTLDITKADLWWRITHIWIIFIPILFTHFVYQFLNIKKRWLIISIYVLGIFFLITNFINGLFISNMRLVFNQFYYDSPPGPFYIPFTIFFFGLVIYSHVKLWQTYRFAKGVIKTQIRYFFFGMAISFIGGGLCFLPVYQIDLYPFLNLTAFLYPIIVGYAISRYQLMDIKIPIVSFFTALVLMIFATEIFLSNNILELSYRATMFIIICFFAALLIKSTLREVENQKKIKGLVEELQITNLCLKKFHQTKTQQTIISDKN